MNYLNCVFPPLFAISIYWHLPILIVVISLVYSSTRYDRWDMIIREAVHWGSRMAFFLFMVGFVLYAVSTWL